MAGRPRSFDRDVALSVAMESFWRDGYDGTSIASLTGKLGIKPPSLYAAFRDKEQLFEEAAQLYVRHFRAALEQSLDAPTAREGVERLLRAFAVNQTDPRMPPGCLVFREPRLAGERTRTRDVIAERIARGRAVGDVPEHADPHALASFTTVVLTGVAAQAHEGATRDQLLSVVATAMDAWPSPSGGEVAARSGDCED
ncbi:TetR/AcrR family transcriptional regulator [Streptomyces sp. NPDC087856]|uniref:TetR/AcrR family transcriptional regulator n=1 Tax=Streptomyces sp. NPDC087856 TaxID=3365811 RepID=UPI003812CB86